MSLAVNHNLMASNVANNLNTHYSKLATSTQRLSTGLRINSAADDAAGLAIRELQRADIAALHQGVRNANDAISMLQTADGALAVIDEKLIRMKELAEQAATGTYDSTQRMMINNEFLQMASEIDRIARATDFNGIKILDGVSNDNYSINSHFNKEYNEDVEVSKEISYEYPNNEFAWHWHTIKTIKTITNITDDINRTQTSTEHGGIKQINIHDDIHRVETVTKVIESQRFTETTGYIECKFSRPDEPDDILKFRVWGRVPNDDVIINYNNYDQFKVIEDTDSYMHYELTMSEDNLLKIEKASNTYDLGKGYILDEYIYYYDLNNDGQSDIRQYVHLYGSPSDFPIKYIKENGSYRKRAPSVDIESTTTNILDFSNDNFYTIPNDNKNNSSIKIHFGSGNDAAEDYYYINKSDATLNGLGLNEVSIETQDKAQIALNTIGNAIVKKDNIRAYYGAMQNRLENTITNITTQAENLQASESRISDVDVATEMTNFVRSQILTQAAVAMLSQANSMPQMAMQIIGG